jgi:formate/nitrite transporter FocA (FNT family)
MSTQSRIGAAAVAAIAFAVAGTTVVGHKIPDQHWGTRGAVLDVAFAIGLIAAV